jgi:L-2-hydroxyglutarate oxidase LhgO
MEDLNNNYDYLIIGAGVIGLTISLELRKRYPNKSIAILEKEDDVAKHASGRNSGVLHAGFYYTEDSLKAKFTAIGNKKMKDFCKTNKLKLNECGKVVVAKNKSEINTIHELYKRGINNGVDVKIISKKELQKINPNINTVEIALYSPSTSSVDPKEVMYKLKEVAENKNIKIFLNERYNSHKKTTVFTDNNEFNFKHLVNCSGLYADKIAHDFNIAKNYIMIPFKGIYLKYNGDPNSLNIHVYPVPNLKNPFLGVHFTKTVDNEIKIGPTSMPAFWRENYHGVKNFNASELIEILSQTSKLFILNSFGFRDLAFEEFKKYNPAFMIEEAESLLNNVENDFESKPAGIRAQLLNKKTNELIMDFKVEKAENSTHVLNAISPAFTSSFPFAEYVVNIIENKEVI